jgi:hypothetical protein
LDPDTEQIELEKETRVRYIQITIVLIAMFLTACSSEALSNPTIATPVASVVEITLVPIVEVTYTPNSNAIQIPTGSPTPTVTHVPTSLPSATPTPSPQPTKGPIKSILLDLVPLFGDGGTVYDDILGRDTPSIILYTDGQLLISGEQYGVKNWYLQKVLSKSEMCALLGRIRETSFFNVEGTGQSYPNDPIYQKSKDYGDGGGGIILHVNGTPSKWVYIYGPALENVVPPVMAAYRLISNYLPGQMKPFIPEQFILRVEQQAGLDWEDWLPTPLPPQAWPSELPPLATLIKKQPEGQEIVLEGQSAAVVHQRMPLPGSGLFTEENETYFVTGRPLLPHETLDYYSVSPWSESSFDLPFKCEE